MRQILLSAALVILLAAPVSALEPERHEAPEFRDGDYWRYRVVEHGESMKTERGMNGVYEIVYASGGLAVFELDEAQRKELTADAGLLVGLVTGTEKLQYLSFPLFVGKSWETDYTFRPRRRDADRLVKAVTNVTGFGVAATGLGTFRAFTIERDARFRDVDHWRFVYYWSPQTRSVVKYSMEVLKGAATGGRREIELIQFGPRR